MNKIFIKAAIFFVKIYKYFFSPLLGNRCRFLPTCSEYFIECLNEYGFFKGVTFGFKRIIWGSDSPVCNLGGGIETWVAATYLMTQDWTNEEKKNFFWSNAINLWDLK